MLNFLTKSINLSFLLLKGDGEVSQDDYRLAKQFDTGSKGYLSDEEFHFAKSHVVNGFVSGEFCVIV